MCVRVRARMCACARAHMLVRVRVRARAREGWGGRYGCAYVCVNVCVGGGEAVCVCVRARVAVFALCVCMYETAESALSFYIIIISRPAVPWWLVRGRVGSISRKLMALLSLESLWFGTQFSDLSSPNVQNLKKALSPHKSRVILVGTV